MNNILIDLRSDTVTMPTDAMREAMFSCAVGDDVIGEDPTLNEIEAYTADLLGKEAGLFTPSGTFANQCAIMTHADSGNEIIASETSHIVQHEAGASAILARVQLRAVEPENGAYMSVEEIGRRLRKDEDIHYPKTGLICMTQATATGNVIPREVMADIHSLARKYGVKVHIDGARLFNAALALDLEPAELAAYGDSVCICLSKGLSAPVGSLLCGTRDFVDEARRNRKILGGGMRQAGFLGAAGLVALKDMRERLKEDHRNAKRLEGLLSGVGGLEITRKTEINMVFAAIDEDLIAPDELMEKLALEGIKIYPPEAGEYRFVTHFGVTGRDVDRFAGVLARILA